MNTKTQLPITMLRDVGSRKCATVLTVPQTVGLHARPAALLARTAQRYDSEIHIRCGRRTVDGKSILGILTLCAEQGSEVVVTAEGCDAEEAVRAIETLFCCSFSAMEFVMGMSMGGAAVAGLGSGVGRGSVGYPAGMVHAAI